MSPIHANFCHYGLQYLSFNVNDQQADLNGLLLSDRVNASSPLLSLREAGLLPDIPGFFIVGKVKEL
ncbi:hypothetical protein TUM17563_56760 [Klebsiella oxytoca]|nr:hypothetical protein TUM17563_56760 [Klebsiella oxytoca]